MEKTCNLSTYKYLETYDGIPAHNNGLPGSFYCKVTEVYDGDTFTVQAAIPANRGTCVHENCGALALASF